MTEKSSLMFYTRSYFTEVLELFHLTNLKFSNKFNYNLVKYNGRVFLVNALYNDGTIIKPNEDYLFDPRSDKEEDQILLKRYTIPYMYLKFERAFLKKGAILKEGYNSSYVLIKLLVELPTKAEIISNVYNELHNYIGKKIDDELFEESEASPDELIEWTTPQEMFDNILSYNNVPEDQNHKLYKGIDKFKYSHLKNLSKKQASNKNFCFYKDGIFYSTLYYLNPLIFINENEDKLNGLIDLSELENIDGGVAERVKRLTIDEVKLRIQSNYNLQQIILDAFEILKDGEINGCVEKNIYFFKLILAISLSFRNEEDLRVKITENVLNLYPNIEMKEAIKQGTDFLYKEEAIEFFAGDFINEKIFEDTLNQSEKLRVNVKYQNEELLKNVEKNIEERNLIVENKLYETEDLVKKVKVEFKDNLETKVDKTLFDKFVKSLEKELLDLKKIKNDMEVIKDKMDKKNFYYARTLNENDFNLSSVIIREIAQLGKDIIYFYNKFKNIYDYFSKSLQEVLESSEIYNNERFAGILKLKVPPWEMKVPSDGNFIIPDDDFDKDEDLGNSNYLFDLSMEFSIIMNKIMNKLIEKQIRENELIKVSSNFKVDEKYGDKINDSCVIPVLKNKNYIKGLETKTSLFDKEIIYFDEVGASKIASLITKKSNYTLNDLEPFFNFKFVVRDDIKTIPINRAVKPSNMKLNYLNYFNYLPDNEKIYLVLKTLTKRFYPKFDLLNLSYTDIKIIKSFYDKNFLFLKDIYDSL